MNPLRTVASLMNTAGTAAANAVPDFLVPGKTLSYQRPAAPVAPQAPTTAGTLDKVPAHLRGAVLAASAHTGYPAHALASQFVAENGGNWDPALVGRADPRDKGVTQLNPIALKTITGSEGGRNYFKDNYGRDFEAHSPSDQILAAGVYLNWLRQFALPAAGIKNPTMQQVMTAYNTGAQGAANAAAGSSTAQDRASIYQHLLKKNGAI